jgi:hypothetical protein
VAQVMLEQATRQRGEAQAEGQRPTVTDRVAADVGKLETVARRGKAV